MSTAAYSEINLHITWHTKSNLPIIRGKLEERLYHFLTHKILETPGVRLHAIGGVETHVHIGVSTPPELLLSDWIGKLKGSSSHYINHEVQPKGLEWQRGYGIVSFGTRDLPWVIEYIQNQKEHHGRGTVHDRLERVIADAR
jgi:putative transposase